jgi:exodeoxyribonuclease VII small subunit
MSEQGVQANLSQDLSFEEALAELQSVVQRLEEGELSLEASIALYERGQKLAKLCQECLDQAELRVEQIQSGDAEGGTEMGGLLC